MQYSPRSIGVVLRPRPPVPERRRQILRVLNLIEPVLALALFTCFVVEFVLQTIILFLKASPLVIVQALIRLGTHIPADFWWHPWETKFGQLIFSCLFWIGTSVFIGIQERNAIRGFLDCVEALRYRSQPRPSGHVHRISVEFWRDSSMAAPTVVMITPRVLRDKVDLTGDDTKLAPTILSDVVDSVKSTSSLPLLAPPTQDVEDVISVEDIQVPEEDDTAESALSHGAHISLLNMFELCLSGPSGRQIISFTNSKHIELIVYLAVKTRDQRWITVEEILRDVYECGEDALTDQRTTALNLFHRHCQNIRTLVTSTATLLGLPEDFDLLETKRPRWRLSTWCHVGDLIELDRCKRLLATKTEEGNEPVQIKAACEAVRRLYTGDLLAANRKKGQVGAWIQEPFYGAINTYLTALIYLAEDTRSIWQAELQEPVKRLYQQREVHLWKDYAFCCARTRFEVLLREQEKLTLQGEKALRRCLRLLIQLHDAFTASEIYHAFEAWMCHEEAEWEPEPRTMQLYRQATEDEQE